jgi:acylphosphatase
MAISGVRIRVFGHVQGVNFRRDTAGVARQLGLTGFVRNEPDGSVTIEAEGDPQALVELVRWAHQGPLSARVDRVDTEQMPVTGTRTFDVR